MTTVDSFDHERMPADRIDREVADRLAALGVPFSRTLELALEDYDRALAEDDGEALGDLVGHSAGIGHMLDQAAEAAGYSVEHCGDNGMTYIYDEGGPDEDDEPHVGHFSRLGGTWWCDTCNSPYCERA